MKSEEGDGLRGRLAVGNAEQRERNDYQEAKNQGRKVEVDVRRGSYGSAQQQCNAK